MNNDYERSTQEKMNINTENYSKRQYNNALVSRADAVYEVNVSKDLVEKAHCVINGKWIELSQLNNMHTPYCYSEYIKSFKERAAILNDDAEDLYRKSTAEYMKKSFIEGKLEWRLEYITSNVNKHLQRMQKLYMLEQDSETGDIYALVVVKDISEERKEQLRNEEQIKYHLEIIQSLAVEYISISVVDMEKSTINIVSANEDSFFGEEGVCIDYPKAMANYEEQKVFPSDVKHFREATKLENIKRHLETQQQYDVRYRCFTGEEVLHMQLRFMRIANGGNAVCAARCIDEIVKQELKRQRALKNALEKAKQAEKAKTAFLFNMSHDIRTPMNAILGFNEITIKNIDRGNYVAALDAAQKSKYAGEHMLGIINDILEISRIENGKLEISEEVVSVKEYFSRIEDMFRLSMEQKGIEFVISDKTKSNMVYTDFLRITQVVANLLSNAYKFTPMGGQVSFIGIETPSENRDYAHFEFRVKDTGVGMSEEFQKKLFLPFEREHSATKTGVQGTGLGLAISHSIATALGGKLICNSLLSKGTEFVFTFDARIAKEVKQEPIQAENYVEKLYEKRVLLVEDNELNREIAVDLLEDFDLEIEQAADGVEALDMVAHSSPGYYDIILMDVQMPVMDGYTAAREIRALDDPVLSSIPIIAMTANAFAKDRKNALEAGMNEHVAKPINAKQLLKTMASLIRE